MTYIVILSDGKPEVLKGVTGIELDGTSRDLIFWFDEVGQNYAYPITSVYSFYKAED